MLAKQWSYYWRLCVTKVFLEKTRFERRHYFNVVIENSSSELALYLIQYNFHSTLTEERHPANIKILNTVPTIVAPEG